MLRSSKKTFTTARPEAAAAFLDESSKASGWNFSCLAGAGAVIDAANELTKGRMRARELAFFLKA